MFGNKKMYKKGMEDALKANEGFSKKQQEALEALRRQVKEGQTTIEEGLAKLGDDIHGIYQYLTAKEKAALYHLNTPGDIKKMGENERQLLVAVLCQLANDEGSGVTELQQTYLRGVQRYVGITTPQAALDDMSVVGEIDSGADQRAIMQTVLEFLYLQDGDEFSPSQLELLNYFSVNQKQSDAIENSVSLLYGAMGAQGIAEKYGTEATAGQSDEEIKEALNRLDRYLGRLENITGSRVVSVSTGDLSGLSVSAYSESEAYKSQSDCERAAERRAEKILKAAQASMDQHLMRQKSSSYYASYKTITESWLKELKDILESMRTAQTSAIIDQMEKPMNSLSKLWSRLGDISDNLASRYRLGGLGDYRDRIEYEKYNTAEGMGAFAEMLGTKYYGYDCYYVQDSVREDGEEKLEGFNEDFDGKAQSEIASMIVEPIRDLIPELRKALSGESEG